MSIRTVPTGLYAALAVSASVFIGVSTALLATDLADITSERSRIYRRIRSTDARLRGLDERRAALEESMKDIELIREAEEVAEEVDGFVEHAEENLGRASFDPISAQVEFARFVGADSLADIDEEQRRELQDRHEELENALGTDRSDGLLHANEDTPVDPEIAAIHEQLDALWEMRLDERRSSTEREHGRTETEIRTLREERRNLVDRYESLDRSELRGTLEASVLAGLLSVVVPLGGYFALVVGVSPDRVPQSIETSGIVAVWAIGLGIVFYHLHGQLFETAPLLPDEPDLDGSGGRPGESNRTE